MMGGGGFMLLGSVILLVLIGLIVWMVWTIANGNESGIILVMNPPEILKKRYARRDYKRAV
ncbi:MAG: hypothetical protein R3A12_12685 [Ignavibacteria bacterium]